MTDIPFKVWKVQQYCRFWISSETVTAEQISAVLGMPPDEVTVRGSRSTAPRVIPIEHSWKIVCDQRARIDEQIATLLSRIEPVAHLVRELVDGGDIDAGLSMVRYFDDEDGDYNAMGWGLEADQLALLAAMGAGPHANEYLDNADPSEYADGL